MLKKAERVNRPDFSTFFKKGRRFHSEHATIVFTPSPSLHGSVVVSKKVSKRAVVRNMLRRRVYAQLYSLKKQGNSGVFIVVLKPSFTLLSRVEARSEIDALIVRIIKSA